MKRSGPDVSAVDTILPVLEPGDHLTAAEFDRRYALRKDIHKAELVQGIVYMPSPVRINEHATSSAILVAWVANYSLGHPGVRCANDGSVRLAPRDRVQPDAMLWYEAGNAVVDEESRHLEGAPDLVVEIAASSAAYDLHEKKESYRRAGVREYVVWRTVDGAVDWFELVDGEYRRLEPGAEGITRSNVFPGLALSIERLVAGEYAAAISPGKPSDA